MEPGGSQNRDGIFQFLEETEKIIKIIFRLTVFSIFDFSLVFMFFEDLRKSETFKQELNLLKLTLLMGT